MNKQQLIEYLQALDDRCSLFIECDGVKIPLEIKNLVQEENNLIFYFDGFQ